ncbi:MAG: class I SAM-dependent RNA methyltransferase [Verrucomicrobia bacterium]|nr:class I SAM-dependent RNA methyltransferase [Verrucomicrobiota bacterium]
MTSSEPRRQPRGFVEQPFAYHHELQLRIETLTNLGQGLGRIDGWVVMVPFALPGELVIARVHRNHKNYSEADLMRIIEPSPARVEPRCPLFSKCGGCQYQNLGYEAQLTWKRQQLTELLKHMARIEFPVEEVIASPREFGYRSKITPHFPVPQDGKISAIGFLEAGSRTRIRDVPRCEIAMPEINERLTTLREEIFRTGPARYKKGATLLLRAAGGRILTDNKDIAIEEVEGIRFEFQAGDFFQNNPFILPAFVRHVAVEASQHGATHLIDAYCGSGLFALGCAKHFADVTGIEISAAAVTKAAHNAAINGLIHCKFISGSAEHIFEGIAYPPADSAVIIDPPRAGCSEDFLQQLFQFGPATVVYVSCNPATQMRDLVKFTEAGYTLSKVQPFDLFPQTKHLECVMTLTKA